MIVTTLCALLLLTLGILCLILRKFAMAIFNVIWAAVIFLCRADLCLENYTQTAFVLALMIIMVNVGCMLGSVDVNVHLQIGRQVHHRQFDARLLTILLGVSGAIFLFFVVRTAYRFGFNLELIRGANNSDSEVKVFSNMLDTIAFYGIAMPMIYVGTLVCAYNLTQKIPTPKYIYIMILVNMVLYILTAGGRAVFIRVALFLAAALLWRMKKAKTINMKWVRYAILVGGALLVAMEIITAARNSRDISFLEQTVEYIRGAVSHMRYQLERLPDDNYYFGYITYGGFFYYPVKRLGTVLGLDMETSNEIMAFLQEYKYIRVGDKNVNYNALIPNAFYYFYDSGYLGAVIFPLLLGVSAGVGERAYERPDFFKFILWATAVYAIVYSPLDGVLWPFRYPTALIYCVILHNQIYKPVCGGADGSAG